MTKGNEKSEDEEMFKQKWIIWDNNVRERQKEKGFLRTKGKAQSWSLSFYIYI